LEGKSGKSKLDSGPLNGGEWFRQGEAGRPQEVTLAAGHMTLPGKLIAKSINWTKNPPQLARVPPSRTRTSPPLEPPDGSQIALKFSVSPQKIGQGEQWVSIPW
jgi:hypothetical protein